MLLPTPRPATCSKCRIASHPHPLYARNDHLASYYHGCSTFLPVFDSKIDSFDALHERSPFAVDAICMVAARCRDGGGMITFRDPVRQADPALGRPSEIHLKCLEEVQATSCASLFLPISKIEAVQAMRAYHSKLSFLHSHSLVLVAGWSDNGWLSCGHAVRMAQELCT